MLHFRKEALSRGIAFPFTPTFLVASPTGEPDLIPLGRTGGSLDPQFDAKNQRRIRNSCKTMPALPVNQREREVENREITSARSSGQSTSA